MLKKANSENNTEYTCLQDGEMAIERYRPCRDILDDGA